MFLIITLVRNKKDQPTKSGEKLQIREQMSGLDFHILALKFLALKRTGLSPIKDAFHDIFGFCLPHSMQLFSADPKLFSKIF